ncbi:MAG: DNA-directed RNA polymerase subunit omega [Lachnospiraceae bacterium]|nr:DNA-directed RNA polymerase subunit omega [Lachnospiraceae bacterium]
MLHPSYSDLMKVVNSEVEEGETPVVNSRYSIVMATSKRARQIIARQTGAGEDMREFAVSKPLSKAVEELYNGELKIKPAEEAEPEQPEPEQIED